MPRVVKKIKKQKSSVKHTKKFFIILSLIIVFALAAIGTAIGVTVYFVTKDDSYSYFANIPSSNKITYDQAKKNIEEYDHVFIFYYNKTDFDPENSTSDAKTETAVENLYARIEDYNKLDSSKYGDQYEDIKFYLVYTGNSKGSGALGTTSSDDDGNTTTTANSISGITTSNVLAYYYAGKYSQYPFGNSKETEDYKYDLTVPTEALTFVQRIKNELEGLN